MGIQLVLASTRSASPQVPTRSSSASRPPTAPTTTPVGPWPQPFPGPQDDPHVLPRGGQQGNGQFFGYEVRRNVEPISPIPPPAPTKTKAPGVAANCGNGRVDRNLGETCDLGTQSRAQYLAKCCNPNTCKFIGNGGSCASVPDPCFFPKCNAQRKCIKGLRRPRCGVTRRR
jgi:hypothetical protein